MFEFLYAKKVDNKELVKLVEENFDKYHTSLHFHADGTTEVFFGSKREESTGEK